MKICTIVLQPQDIFDKIKETTLKQSLERKLEAMQIMDVKLKNRQDITEKPASLITTDNFWNVLTWVAMPLGAYIAFINENGWGFFGSFTLLPYLLAKLNNVSCTEDGKVLTKRGKLLNSHLPFKFSRTLYRTIFTAIISIILINIFNPSFAVGFIMIFFLLWLPISYFIRNNIPVSAFFNANAWQYNEEIVVERVEKRASYESTKSSAPSTTSDYSYRYLPQNFYHRK